MRGLRIAVIDDDVLFANEFAKDVEAIGNSNEIQLSVNVFDMPQLLNFRNSCLEYDLIFLDIEMPLINGVELAKQIGELKKNAATPYIVFVTAKDNLVFEALGTFPYHFIRKSHMDDLEECIVRVSKMLQKSLTYPVKSGREIKSVDISGIIYLEKQGNYITYHTVDGTLQERGAIDEKQAVFKPFGFLRPNQSVLVNAAHITAFTTKNLRLSNDVEIDVSRSYSKTLKTEFNEWMVKAR